MDNENEVEIPFTGIAEDLGIKDRRTINKYLKELQKLDWVGYNKETRNYFPRGFESLRKRLGLKNRIGVICEFSNFKSLSTFLPACLINLITGDKN